MSSSTTTTSTDNIDKVDNCSDSNLVTTTYIILTGATGFLGQHILHSILTTGIIIQNNNNNDDDVVSNINHSNNNKKNNHKFHIYALCHSTQDLDVAVRNTIQDNERYPNITIDIVNNFDITNPTSIDQWISSIIPRIQQYHNDDEDSTKIICIHTAALSSPKLCQDDPIRANKINVPDHFFQSIYNINKDVLMIALSTDQIYDGKNPPYKEEETGGDAKDDDDDNNNFILQPCNVYGKTKLEMEKKLIEISKSSLSSATAAVSAKNTIILRSSIIIGPKAPFHLKGTHDTFLHFCQLRGGSVNEKTTFYIDECRSIVSVYDVIQTIKWFINHYSINNQNDNDRSDDILIYNMGGPNAISRWDMANAVYNYFQYDTNTIIAASKSDEIITSHAVPSPLNITMDSTKLYSTTGLIFQSFSEMVQCTFNDEKMI